jgi:hypothetical protein
MPTLLVPRVLLAPTLLVALLAWTAAAQAQEPASAVAPAHVAYLDGTVTLDRDGALEVAAVNMPIIAGDRLSTTAGRLELLFPDGSALDLDENSSMDVLSPTLVRLVAGRAMMIVAGASDPAAAVRYQIDTPVASVRIDGPGEYRIAVLDSRDAETELAVVRGYASLATERGEIAVRAGERSVAFENGTPSSPQTFNSARFDAFDRWVAGRRDARRAATSAQYLPRELQTYGGTLDRYGSWQYEAPYGYVWYPTVAAEWRPYYYGNWSPIRSYGWTWIGLDLWSWPTHHYGRWGHAGARWFWIPGRTWGPAWVSWAAAPGYVSWCPLGFDGRPVFALSIGSRNSWDGWTVVPRGSFGYRNSHVNRYAIQPRLLPRTTPFIAQSVAPVAVPRDFGRRSGAADRSAGLGERAVPRSSSPGRRPPSSSADTPLGTRNNRGYSPERRRDADSPAAMRDFRQPLPDAGRTRAVDRATPRSTQPAAVDGPGGQNRSPRATSRDSWRLPTADPPSSSAGRRPVPGDDPRTRGDGFGRAQPDGRRASGDRPVTSDRPRSPEVATPRYGRPGIDRQPQGGSPSPGTIQRSRPVDRAPSVAPERRGAGASPRGGETGAPPAGRTERAAPGRAEPRGERAVPRSEGSTRGTGRRR